MRLLAALLLLVFVLVTVSGCSQNSQKFVGTWRCEPRTTGALSYTFASDGTYREEYLKDTAGSSTGTITGTWSLGYTDDSKPGIKLNAKEDPCAGGMMPYRFDGDDKLIMGNINLVRQR